MKRIVEVLPILGILAGLFIIGHQTFTQAAITPLGLLGSFVAGGSAAALVIRGHVSKLFLKASS